MGEDVALEKLRTLRRIKRFQGGRHSAAVYLLEDGRLVAKYFDLAKPHHVAYMLAEVKNLQRARDSGFTPRLVAADWPKGVLYLTYCGKSPKKITSKMREQLRHQVRTLRDRYHLSRPFIESLF